MTAAIVLYTLAALAWPPAQRQAALYEAWVETRLTPQAISPAGDIGLWQWKGPRKQALLAYAQAQGRDWQEPELQARFMDREWRGMPGSREFFRERDPAAAARIFCRHFERRRCR